MTTPQTAIKSDAIRVRVTPDQARAMRKIGDNQSQVIRAALDWYLAHPALKSTSEEKQ